MTPEQILEAIEKHNLSVRRVPNAVYGTYEMRHHKEGNEIIEIKGRQFTKETTIPKHAGWYMVQPIKNIWSTVHWSFKTCFPAPTLAGSIEFFLEAKDG